MNIGDKILNLGNLYLKILKDSLEDHSAPLSKEEKQKFEELHEEITDRMVWSPGDLIYMKDPVDLGRAKAIIDFMWRILDTEELSEDLTGPGYGGFMVNTMCDYADRVKMLKPTFVSVEASPEFSVFFKEAMSCWMFGLNNSSLILCCSLLEFTLREKLAAIDEDLVYEVRVRGGDYHVDDVGLGKLIKNAAKQGLLSYEEKEDAFEIKDLRDGAVHKLRDVSSEQTYNAILKTKDLTESLLSGEK